MLGWEFPPFISGGLGTACQGLTQAMTRLRTRILFVLPKAVGSVGSAENVPARQESDATAMQLRAVPSEITSPYQYTGRAAADRAGKPAVAATEAVPSGGLLRVTGTGSGDGYEGDLLGRIGDYAARCLRMTEGETFNVIHAHDWVTYPAGMMLAARTGRPLVVHVHSTEFDRSGEAVNQPVYDIERAGMHAAQAVIAVSHLTKRIVVERYGVAPEKVQVVHNGIDPKAPAVPRPASSGPKTVLFLGRITMQKGRGISWMRPPRYSRGRTTCSSSWPAGETSGRRSSSRSRPWASAGTCGSQGFCGARRSRGLTAWPAST